ncbi:MAG TPA: toll/interleukin-1 receptor domain-containing protein [Mucilaginibacter sp.]|nr:toll/interleukin-1 receptor domain-containing protein [Mucilaginibacter sp.]
MSKRYDIFISHSKEDNKLAVALCHFLEERQFRCWMAPRDVQAGRDYAACIIDGIQSSRIMIVILSEYSNRSHHVRNEVERAFNHQVAILPFRIRDVIPEQSLEYFLSSYHWLDALDGQAESYFEDLYRHCFALLKAADQSTEQPPPKDEPRPPYRQPDPIDKRSTQPDPFDNKKKKDDPKIPWRLYLAGAAVVAVIIVFFVLRAAVDKNAIEFKNNTGTAVYIELDGKTDTIPSLSSYNYKARKNARIKTKAYAYWTNTTGGLLGLKLEWNIDTVVHADGNFTYPLNTASNYFLLKVTNNSYADINYVTVNGDDYGNKAEMKIKIPNDGKIYILGYYKIFTNTKVEVWNTGNYYLKWTNGSNLTFYDSYNQVITIPYK